MVGVIDYGMGNLRSVMNALLYLGENPQVVKQPDELNRCERIILPGVGSYAKAMSNLAASGFDLALKKYVQGGAPCLGICLGMQLLSNLGFEPVKTSGLGLIGGEVKLLDIPPDCQLPHVGWNNLILNRPHPIFENVKKNVDYYFVHSYQFIPDRDADALACTEYGNKFTSAVAHKNIVAVQFHPEKSQENGLKIIENFCEWDGQC